MSSLCVTEYTFSTFLSQLFDSVREKFLDYLKHELEEALIAYRDQEIIGTAPYQRGNIRKRWGYRTRKWIDTPYGSLENVRIPRVRGRHHEIRLFADRFVKRSELLKESMLEMFVAGVSTRSISGLMKRFTGTGISAGAICRLRRFVKEELSQMRRSRIDSSIRILVVDGVWGRYRKGGKQGVCLVALGVDKTGKTHLLDWLGCDAESGAHWRRLFRRLRERGLKQVELLVSDDHKAAVEAYHQVWSERGAHQLCLWHFQQQLQKRLSSISWGKRRRFVHHYWEVFNAFSLEECEHRARQFLAEWKAHSEMVDYFQAHWPQLTNYYRYPEEWRHRIRTVNLAEQFFAQLQTFIRRFPGWIDEEHIELLLAFFVKTRRLFQFKKMEIPKTQLNFNTFY